MMLLRLREEGGCDVAEAEGAEGEEEHCDDVDARSAEIDRRKAQNV
jgi:hypothetical protein